MMPGCSLVRGQTRKSATTSLPASRVSRRWSGRGHLVESSGKPVSPRPATPKRRVVPILQILTGVPPLVYRSAPCTAKHGPARSWRAWQTGGGGVARGCVGGTKKVPSVNETTARRAVKTKGGGGLKGRG